MFIFILHTSYGGAHAQTFSQREREREKETERDRERQRETETERTIISAPALPPRGWGRKKRWMLMMTKAHENREGRTVGRGLCVDTKV